MVDCLKFVKSARLLVMTTRILLECKGTIRLSHEKTCRRPSQTLNNNLMFLDFCFHALHVRVQFRDLLAAVDQEYRKHYFLELFTDIPQSIQKESHWPANECRFSGDKIIQLSLVLRIGDCCDNEEFYTKCHSLIEAINRAFDRVDELSIGIIRTF